MAAVVAVLVDLVAPAVKTQMLAPADGLPRGPAAAQMAAVAEIIVLPAAAAACYQTVAAVGEVQDLSTVVLVAAVSPEVDLVVVAVVVAPMVLVAVVAIVAVVQVHGVMMLQVAVLITLALINLI